jgi:hypothetical protein
LSAEEIVDEALRIDRSRCNTVLDKATLAEAQVRVAIGGH